MMDSGSVLDFMNLKNYPDMTLDMLNPLGNPYIIFSSTQEEKLSSIDAVLNAFSHNFFPPILFQENL